MEPIPVFRAMFFIFYFFQKLDQIVLVHAFYKNVQLKKKDIDLAEIFFFHTCLSIPNPMFMSFPLLGPNLIKINLTCIY